MQNEELNSARSMRKYARASVEAVGGTGAFPAPLFMADQKMPARSKAPLSHGPIDI